MKIRPLVEADVPAVHVMILALGAYHQDFDAKVTVTSLKRDALGDHPWVRILVAEDEAGLMGYVALLPLAKVADGLRGIDINHMYVAAAVRGRGIGRALIEASADVAHALGCSYMFIGTAPQNTAAQAAYLACGFSRWADAGPRFRRAI